MASAGVQLEQCEALTDIRNVMQEYGDDVKFQIRVESEVTRDKYNSIKQSTSIVDYTFKCYPIVSNPTQDQMNKGGIKQKVDVMMHSAYKDWLMNGLTEKSIDTLRMTVIWNDETWNIKEKNNISQIGDKYLYVVLGLTKK
jgi:hypothetical protein